MENLIFEKFEMQNYFKKEKITKIEAQTFFNFCTRMEIFKNNFRNGSIDIDCDLCFRKESIFVIDYFLVIRYNRSIKTVERVATVLDSPEYSFFTKYRKRFVNKTRNTYLNGLVS